MSVPFIPPGATLGVVGGGQLGRMFAHAAQTAGYAVAVLEPDAGSPAGRVAEFHLKAPYTDPAALAELATTCAAVTTEFENVPAAVLATLAKTRPVAPAADAVAVCQDRAREKRAFTDAGIPCAPHAVIERAEDFDAPGVAALFPAILKTARLGYDGKGQRTVADVAAARAAYADFRAVPCVLEQRLALAAEVSAIVARGADGTVVALPVQENVHRDGILAVTRAPARVEHGLQQQAVRCAAQLAERLGYVGVLCVEFFVLADGRLVANEMAPRPHNSGHHSIDSCDVSQFDLQVRTMTGAPLTVPRQHSPALMLNLLGDLWQRDGRPGETREPDWAGVLALPGAHLHLYGKAEARPGRKMGHLTFTGVTADVAEAAAIEAARVLGLPDPRR